MHTTKKNAISSSKTDLKKGVLIGMPHSHKPRYQRFCTGLKTLKISVKSEEGNIKRRFYFDSSTSVFAIPCFFSPKLSSWKTIVDIRLALFFGHEKGEIRGNSSKM